MRCRPGWIAAIGGLTVLGAVPPALAQSSARNPPRHATPIVFQNVSVVPMDRERVERAHTVVVQGDRIVAVGSTSELPVPDGARVIDATGRYLLPGLTDAHVHLESWAGSRPDFGDAPLYLAHGVTTVINLRGTPLFLEWKRRVQAGELPGPTIYTAGEFVIGPRGPTLARDSGEVVVGPNATTPEDVEREVARQAAGGVDVIKYYGGLARPAYLRLHRAASQHGVPVVGHRPLNLGFDDLLEARQSLAHVYMLTNLYFWPMFSSQAYLLASVGSLAALALIVVTWWRPASPADRRARVLSRGLLLAALIALLALLDGFVLEVLGLAAGTLAVLFTVIAACVGLLTVVLVVLTGGIWNDGGLSRWSRLRPVFAGLAGGTLAIVLTAFWVPIAWRSTQGGIDRMAIGLRDAGIGVQTTLIAFEGLTLDAAGGHARRDDPALDYVGAATRDAWRRLPVPEAPLVSPAALDFMKTVTAALHRADVRLMAGTDALGAPWIVPGASLHREFQLLLECGLTPYDVIRTATAHPALFLGRSDEFGTIAVGRRADLLLVNRNPLASLEALRAPEGVMVRGRWFDRDELRQMLEALRSKD